MAQSPPLSQLPKYPVSAGIGLIAIGLFFAIGDLSDPSARAAVDPYVLDQRAFWAEPWRILTSTVVHANLVHVGFNAWWMWILGTYVEEHFGHLRTLGLFVVLAVGSAAAEYALSIGGVGLSGVVYGLFGFLWVLDRHLPRFRGAMDPQRTRFFVFWFFLCIVLTEFGVLAIANVAHGSGALLGALIGWTYALSGPRRWGAAAGIVLTLALAGLGASELRASINPRAAASTAFDRGVEAFEAEEWSRAIENFERATEHDDTAAAAWFNIGLCHRALHDADAALAAHERALALEPGNGRFREAVDQLKSISKLPSAETDPKTDGAPETETETKTGTETETEAD